MSSLHALLALAEPWLRHYGYAALFLAVMAEGMGIPTPGQSLLVAAALLAGKGLMSLPATLLCALFATLAGDNLGYLIGRRGGRRLVLRLGVDRLRLRRLAGFYRRFGAWPVLIDRFFDGARQLGSLLAGVVAMPWPRFVVFDALGGLSWVGAWGWGAYQFEGHAAWWRGIWTRVDPAVAGLLLVALAALGFWLRRGRERRGSPARREPCARKPETTPQTGRAHP